jgi:hypothetical protein
MELRLRELSSSIAVVTSCQSSGHELARAASSGVVELRDLLQRGG